MWTWFNRVLTDNNWNRSLVSGPTVSGLFWTFFLCTPRPYCLFHFFWVISPGAFILFFWRVRIENNIREAAANSANWKAATREGLFFFIFILIAWMPTEHSLSFHLCGQFHSLEMKNSSHQIVPFYWKIIFTACCSFRKIHLPLKLSLHQLYAHCRSPGFIWVSGRGAEAISRRSAYRRKNVVVEEERLLFFCRLYLQTIALSHLRGESQNHQAPQ